MAVRCFPNVIDVRIHFRILADTWRQSQQVVFRETGSQHVKLFLGEFPVVICVPYPLIEKGVVMPSSVWLNLPNVAALTSKSGL